MKNNILKKGISAIAALALAAGICMPAAAFADPISPSTDYSGGDNGSTTQLTLQAANPNTDLASNAPESTVKSQAKVQVPVAIHYVAKANGVSLESVQRRHAAKWREKIPAGSGVWYQDDAGAWLQK